MAASLDIIFAFGNSRYMLAPVMLPHDVFARMLFMSANAAILT